MIKNIIFDMDGVLIDSESCIREASIRMFKKRGITAFHDDFLPFTGMSEEMTLVGIAEKYGSVYAPGMKDEIYGIYGQIAGEQAIPFYRIGELIKILREKNYKLAVATSAESAKVLINLSCLKLSENDFDAVVTASEVKKLKPEPDVFLAAAKKIGAEPKESIVVEDAVAGCMAAKSAGMLCIGVTSTFDADMLKKAGADYTVAKTYDIIDIVEMI